MSVGGRIRVVRETLNLTTRKFGEGIGMSGGSITNIENGVRNLTERTSADICRTYGVNPVWLQTGEGEMFTPSASGQLDEEQRILTDKIMNLSVEDRRLIESIIDRLLQ